MSDLQRHAAEFRSALENHKYELSPDGIYIPGAKVFVQGVFGHDVNGQEYREDKNLVVNEGLLHMLGVELYSTTKISTWYLALFSANYTPAATLTAATFPATASEITSGTEGYTEAVRQTYVPAAPAANAITNTASKAAFTIATASTLTVNGAALLSSNVKGDTSGVLFAASKFSATRTLQNNDVFNLSYRLQLTAS